MGISPHASHEYHWPGRAWRHGLSVELPGSNCLKLIMVNGFFSLICIDFQFFHNTSYLVQYHNAGARKNSVPGHNFFHKIESFIREHFEEGENSGSS